MNNIFSRIELICLLCIAANILCCYEFILHPTQVILGYRTRLIGMYLGFRGIENR